MAINTAKVKLTLAINFKSKPNCFLFFILYLLLRRVNCLYRVAGGVNAPRWIVAFYLTLKTIDMSNTKIKLRDYSKGTYRGVSYNKNSKSNTPKITKGIYRGVEFVL